jgi:hypothetical protein
MPLYLESFKAVVDRKTGMGMKIVKFHLPTHHANDMKRYGPATSWDSSTGESNHVGFKGAARKTQKNTSQFDEQTAIRCHENLVIERALLLLKPTTELIGVADPDENQPTNKHRLRGRSFYVWLGNLYDETGTLSTWSDYEMQERVLALFRDEITPNVITGAKIWLYTEFRMEHDDILFRANPGISKGSRHDWANIEWEPFGRNKNSVIPGRISVFFTITNWISGRSSKAAFFPITGNGDYAIVSSLIEGIYVTPTNVVDLSHGRITDKYPNYRAHQGSELIFWSCLETTSKPPLVEKSCIVPITAVVSTCIAVPFDLSDDGDGIEWLIIPSINRWTDIFSSEMKEKTRRSN